MVFLVLSLVCAVIAGAAVLSFVTKYRQSSSPSLREIGEMWKLANETPRTAAPRSISAATSIYRPRIEKDFADFHYAEAVNAVRTAVLEYLAIRYEDQPDFKQVPAADRLAATVDRQPGHTVEDETVHQVWISGYVRSRSYATVTYQASVGYKLDGEPVEERYEVESTFRLTDNGIPQKSLVCQRCGGTYDSAKDTICPYCGADVVRDTYMSWPISSIRRT